MDPIVDLARGAEDNALAVALADHIRAAVAEPAKRADFRALRGSVLMVSEDTGSAVTLRFDLGRLTVHDGSVGIPSVTFCGDDAALLALRSVPLTRFFRLPLPLPGKSEGAAVIRALAGRIARGELKIYGILAHPRLLLRLVRLLGKTRLGAG